MRKYRQHSWLSSYFLLQKKKQESSGLETWIKRLSLLDNFIVSIVKLTIFVFFLIFLIILITEISRTEIILDPLSMPEELIKSGYSGTVVAERLLDEAKKIEFETNKINERQSFRSDKETFKYIGKLTADIQFSDIQIPGANFTIRTLVRYLRQLTPLKK